ncbi:MAG: lysophospholipid acyltransferase family protein [Candidatus Cloacimonetes bacterium]|nr:lysophospholipid acyltransferase family protein [Candidatus Cloacimonadota bacterium]
MPSKELVNKIEYYSFRAWLAGFKLLPRFVVRYLLISLFHIVGYRMGIRKQIALKQLRQVYPDSTLSSLNIILKKMYHNMALTVLEEYLTDDETLFSMCKITGREFVDEALSLGRGAILATAHFGNWEAARILPKAGIPLSVIAKAQRNNLFDNYTNDIRRRCGLKVIDMKKGLRDIVKQLHEGRFVAILMDQNAGSSGLMMDFLGFPASHWKGVAKISLRYQIPIVPGFARRTEDGTIVFEFSKPILHEELDDKEQHYRVVLEEVNKIIEKEIYMYPDQWFWVHKRWKHGFDMFA